MLSSGQKSQVIKRSTFLNSSQAFSTTSRQSTIQTETNEKKELRRYPTEWVEQIDNKSDNHFHHNILNKSKDERNPNLASPSKIFGTADPQNNRLHTTTDDGLSAFRRKNLSLGNLGSWQYTSQLNTQASQNNNNISRTLSRRLDLAVPLSELLEISRQLDCANQEDIRSLSRSYVNEMFSLSQTIQRVLKNMKR